MTHFGWVEVHAVDHCNQNCRWCHNYSPFSPEREFQAEEYFDGLDVLAKRNVSYTTISVMGGEPFLHSDILQFAYKLYQRYTKPLAITTNGFWLSVEAIALYHDLWKITGSLRVSNYPSVASRLGGQEEIRRLLETVKRYNPQIYIDYPDKGIFKRLDFFNEYTPPQVYCGNAECTALLPDMRMARCGAGGYMHLAPEGMLSDSFCQSNDMFYDLKNFKAADFWLWRMRYPMDACGFCSFGQKGTRGVWKVEKGHRIFNAAYEAAYRLNLGKQMLNAKRVAHARQQAAILSDFRRPTAAAPLLEAYIALVEGDGRSSLEAFSRALELDPTNREALAGLKSLQQGRKTGSANS